MADYYLLVAVIYIFKVLLCLLSWVLALSLFKKKNLKVKLIPESRRRLLRWFDLLNIPFSIEEPFSVETCSM